MIRVIVVAFLVAVTACSQPYEPPAQGQRKFAAELAGVRSGSAITLHSAVTSFTTPTASGGADISAARAYGAGPEGWTIAFTASAATVIPGPLAIWDEEDDGAILNAGLLNDGADIIIPSSTVGVEYEVNLGTAKKLQVGPAPTATNLTGSTSTATNGATVTVKARARFEVRS